MNRFLLAFSLGTCALAATLMPSSARAATRKVSVSIGDARLVEPPSGQKSMIFTVALSAAWPSDISVYYSTSVGPNAGSAPAGTLAEPDFDYTSLDDVLTIPAGTTRAQILVPILADAELEKDETFAVTLNDLTYVEDPNNAASTVALARVLARGTIVEPSKGVALGGQLISYTVSPTRSFDSNGDPVDKFDTRAVATPLSGVSVVISGPGTSVTATTDAKGKYSVLVRPGTYTLKPRPFIRQDESGVSQYYSIPARTVTVSTVSNANNFYFYGVAGTVGVPSDTGTGLDGAYVKVEARPVGASPTSTPVAIALAQYQDFARVSRGFRFFLPALPEGKYTLTVKDVSPNNFVTFYYAFPTFTVTLPETVASNRPVAHVEFKGVPKNVTPQSKSSSAKGS